MLKLEDFKTAKKRVDEVIEETHLIHSDAFSSECGNDVYIKPENLQKTGAFKIRGAFNKIVKLDDTAKKKGLIASSAGNHAQGVAYAAKKLGVKATICMPAHTPLIKVDATKQHGADVVLYGEVYDEAYAKAVELQKSEGYTFVHPFDDEDVIEGQGTIAIEILEELPDADVILVPIGGGGLIAGIACAAKQINPNVKIYGVEPEGAASALASIHEDQVVTLAEANTIADGTAVKTIGNKTFEYIKKYVDGIITVDDYELMDAFLLLVEKHKLVAEGSGILALAGLKKLYEKNKKVVSLISGGNIDVLTISSMINKGLISRGRIFTFSVQLQDKPGQLELVSKVLNQCNANVIAVDHNQFKNFARFSEVELRVTVETNGNSHIDMIINEFDKLGYKITKIN
ncbi:threonine ammonia-lyase [Thomasclavelia cocleata]|uniref:L-threonine dehydratase catabolic TdcB n=1 Tax=Thomasclavelia cocleata TaxID=69824 RepID=A0A1I0C2L0_9FIRM|nr:threonine ammonia-lyase [Thomasclavelia cocleata]MCR1959545.1 threonine ammonia-lyase [Thomasclavelia cocleata]NDO42169.1 threonine ammonia-lyase [Thomasclavelia cocleata]PJN81206.1 threonine ammonia-lyase [Thomasclavelia cocleata]SET13244.1 L-threonine ammonia-lyase [Thomasclavelia cocleata]